MHGAGMMRAYESIWMYQDTTTFLSSNELDWPRGPDRTEAETENRGAAQVKGGGGSCSWMFQTGGVARMQFPSVVPRLQKLCNW
jgi:hypothetical protein